MADNLLRMAHVLQNSAELSLDAPSPLTRTLCVPELQSFYELCWASAPGALFALDCESGRLVDANPGAERLSGYSRSELLDMSIDQLHPMAERELVVAELLMDSPRLASCSGFHLQCRDGSRKRVAISTSASTSLAGQSVAVCVYTDISDQLEKEHLLSTQSWALSAYAGAALALGVAESAGELKQSICEAITSESVYALAWIGIAEDSPEKQVRIAAAAGTGVGYMDGLQVSWSEDNPMGRGPTGICLRSGKVKILEDSESSEFFAPWRERAHRSGIRSSVAIPFFIEDDRRGALMVYSVFPNAFEPAAIEVFEHLAIQIGHGIHAIEQNQLLRAEQIRLEKLRSQLNDALSAMVSPIVTAMEMRDPYTAGHQSRVAEIAVAIGRELGWPEEQLQGLRVAALVHDIGKISIPTAILTKPGKLSAEEWRVINAHPKTGYAILKDIPFIWPIAEIVRQHHEKLDGSGYPFGLAGERDYSRSPDSGGGRHCRGDGLRPAVPAGNRDGRGAGGAGEAGRNIAGCRSGANLRSPYSRKAIASDGTQARLNFC